MRTAYCMTCDDQVHETPSGTCPAGHPLSSFEDTGPEPWVGFAASAAGAAAASRPAERAESSPAPRYHSVDVVDLQQAPVAHGTNGNGNGHAPAVAPPPPAPEPRREPAVGDASDELSAMLADAFDRVEPPAEDTPGPADVDDLPDVPAPADVPEPPATPTDASDAPPARDWDDLATLAAELELQDRGGADGPEPRDAAQPAAEVVDASEVPVDEAPTAPPPPTGPPLSQEPPPTGDPATEVPPPTALDPVAPLDAEVDPLWDPVDAEVDPLWDPVDAPAVPSATEAPEAEPAPPTPTVDLGNFTARGTRVRGGSDTGRRSQNKKSRRKR